MKNLQWISFVIRITLAILIFSGSFAHLFPVRFYTADPKDIHSWLVADLTAFCLLIISSFLLLGFELLLVCTMGISLLLINHIQLLLSDPFYNTFHHTLPFLLLFAALLYLSENHSDIFSLDTYRKRLFTDNYFLSGNCFSLCALALRIFTGAIFLAQGIYSVTHGGIIHFAETLYLQPYAGTLIPSCLLWIMGVLNPFIEIIGGILIIIGWRQGFAYILMAFFLISIVIGHMLSDPFESSGDLSSYGLNNLLCVLVLLLLCEKYNRWTVDYYIRSRLVVRDNINVK